MFQIEIDCTAVIISNADNLLSFANPNAAVIPIKIGTNVPARAVALGTINASTKLTKIVPITRRPGGVPTFDIIYSAIRLCRPVISIAVAKTKAPATNSKAVELNPPIAIVSASFEPINSDGLSIEGDKPTNTANNATIKIALTGYDTASDTHKITANANTASARCPATGSDSGFGNKIIINNTTKAAISDIALYFFTTLSSNVIKFINNCNCFISIN